ncbi:MAG: response regulator, partial [Acidobacteria bacterium]
MTTPAKLLYLEDDEIDRRAFLRLVREQKLPWDVRIAQTLAAARDILSHSRFDAIIADYHLPDGDSTELFDAIQDTPFILLTRTVQEDLVLRTLARGANDYLPKAPDQWHLAALPITVDKALCRGRIMDAEQRITRELRLPVTASTAVGYAIAVTDRDGVILWANRDFVDMTGYPLEEIVGRTHSILKSGFQDEGLYRDLWTTIKEGKVWHCELVNRRKDGTLYIDDQTIVPLLDAHGQADHFISIKQDITERRVAESALRQHEQQLAELNRTLEQRIARRTEQLERGTVQLRQLHAKLTQAEQLERRKLAEMLHDGLQQLLVAAKMRIDEVRGRGRDTAFEALEEVDRLLSESIEASRSLTLELFPPVLHDLGLVPALEWLADWIQEKQKLNVEVRAADDVEPPSEDMKIFLFQAVRELLFNVSKHAGVDTAIVSLHRDPTELTVQVIDRGKGIDPSRLPASENRETFGFGLFSVQQRLEWMGGEMRIDSAPDRGTEITLKVPFPQEPPIAGTIADTETPVRTPRKMPRSQRLRVLLADDHKIVRKGIALLLKGKPGVEVVGEADDGVMAVELARTLNPDVVLMDVSMPRLDGVEATRQILRERPNICVIGVSMHEEEEIAAALRRAGAVGYVSKTSAQDTLLATIRQCCFRDP